MPIQRSCFLQIDARQLSQRQCELVALSVIVKIDLSYPEHVCCLVYYDRVQKYLCWQS